jgi:hypothetical protein
MLRLGVANPIRSRPLSQPVSPIGFSTSFFADFSLVPNFGFLVLSRAKM